MNSLQRDTIDVGALEDATRTDECGALITFKGVTRNHFEGRKVQRLEYEAYEPMAMLEMTKISTKVKQKWPGVLISIAHRLGVVGIGECSVAIVVAAPHRESAYLASRFAIDQLKFQVPIWKKEIYTDGTSWKANK